MRYVREKWASRILPYLDDFLLAPAPPGWASTVEDCSSARARLEKLFKRIGISRHPSKGCWEGSQRLDHLGVHIETGAMKVFVYEHKITRMRRMSRHLLLLCDNNRRLVPVALLRRLCRECVSLSLALPLARFYTRSLYVEMAN